jgi:hypothetical protein
MRLAPFLLSAAAACSFHASYDGTHYQCGAGDTCPSGQTCFMNVCIEANNVGPDGGLGIDAPPGTPDASSSTPDAAPAVSPCGALTALRDDFSTNRDGTYWNSWSDSATNATVTNGHLSLQISSNTGDQGAGYGSNYYYDFTNSEGRVTVTSVADVETILEVRDPNGAKLQMIDAKGQLTAREIGTASPGDRASVTYDPTVHKQWRLREAAGFTYWEWSTDGSSWTELWHEVDPIAPQHVLLLLAADGNGPSEARFDDLNVATVDPGLCGSSTVMDDFPGTAFDPQWDTWNDNHTTIAVTGGGAVITTDGTSGVWAGFQTKHLLNLVGDSFYADASNVEQESGFVSWLDALVPGDGTTYLEFSVEANTLYLLQTINGTNVNQKTLTYDPVAHRYWRFRVDGTTAYWDTSPDGVTWTQRFMTTTQLDPSAVQMVFGGGEYQAVSAGTTRIGSVNVP